MRKPSPSRSVPKKSFGITPAFIGALSRHLACFALVAGGASQARADLFWDPLADGDGVIGGSGSWNTSSLFWDPTGLDAAGNNVAWTVNSTQVAVFGGPTAGTVALAGPISAGGLIFNTAGYTVSGGNLTLNGTATINAAADATVTSVLDGASGLIKTGAGTLTLGSSNTYSGSTVVNSGTLALSYTSGQTPAGSGAIVLNGGILSLTPTANTSVSGLSGRQFASTISDTARIDFTQTAATTRTDTTINTTGIAGGQAVQWVGKINITDGSAPYTFRINSDDGSRLFIDGVLVVQNDGPKGAANGDSAPITLSSGLHDIRIDYVNSGGAGAAVFSYSGPDQAVMGVVPSTRLFAAESNTTAASSNAVILGAGIGNDLNVGGSSTIALNGGAFTQTQLGAAAFASGSALNLTSEAGQTGKALRFAGSGVFAGNTSLNLAGDGTNGANLYFDGTLLASNGATITKTGNGRLYFNQTAVANTLDSSNTLDVQAGALVLTGTSVAGSFNPIGSAGIKLGGGNLVLDSKVGSTTAPTVFNNAVQVTENATIQTIVGGGSLTTLGGTGTALSVAAGKTLTLDAIAGGNPVGSLGAALNVASNLSGSGNLTVTSTRVGTLPITPVNGIVTLSGNNTAYTGIATVLSTGSLAFTNTLAATDVSLAGTLSLLNDGNGSAAPETFSYDSNVTLAGASTIVVNRLGTTFAPLFTTAANKSLQIGDLITGGNALTITNTSGYGLVVGGTTTLSGAESFTVANVTIATTGIAHGLTLSGLVTGGSSGVTKAGAGTMVLTNAGNNFTGNIAVTGGVLGTSSDQALGNAANSITLNGATAGFEAFGTFATNRSFTFSNATSGNNQILVTRGNTLTINSALSGVNGFQKSDPGVLVLTNNASTLSGAVVVSGGVLRITQSGALGATSGLTVAANEGTAFQLDGSGGALTFARPITLSGSSGISNNGALENFAGSNTVSGAVSLGGASTIGNSAAGTTLSLTGGVSGAFGLTFNGAGNTTVTTTALGAVTGLTRNGSGSTIISVASPLFVSAATVNGGTLVLNGAGTFGTAAVANSVTSGGTLWVDDSGTAVANRQGNTRTMSLSSGTFRYTANGGAASSETVGTLTSVWGGNTIRVDTGGAGSTLTFAGVAGNAVSGGSTLVFQSNADGTGAAFNSAANKVVFTAAPTLTGNIIQRALVLDSAGGTPAYNFATYSGGIAAFTAYNATNDLLSAAATDTMRLTASSSLQAPKVLNALASSGAGLAISSNSIQTLTLTSANLLVQSGDLTVGNNVVLAGGATELALNVAPGATLNINGTLSSTNNVTVGLGGTLNLNSRQFSNTGANYLTINAGTVKLNGGNNTLYSGQTTGANQNLAVGPGGTLDLNGKLQVAGDLRSPNNNAFFGSGGIVTSTGGAAMLVSRQANANWGGQITGPVTFVMGNTAMGNVERFYQDNTYTGRTAVMGGTLELMDFGRLSGTTAIDLHYGVLNITNTSGNNGRANLTDRVPDSIPITLRGGAILLQGRIQSASSETLGAVTLARGNSNLNVTAGGTGVNSSELTLTSLTQGNIDAVTNVQGASGQLGNATRLFIGNGMALLNNNILPVWIESGGTEFMSYNATTGAMPLSAVGAPGYTGTTLPTVNNATSATGNYRIGASGVVPSGGLTVNTLNVNGAFNVTFGATNSTDVLNLGASGLMKTGATGTSIGSTVDEGRLTAGGASPAGTVPLYLFNGVNGTSFTVNSRIVDNGASPVRLIVNNYNGGTTAITNPNNSYTGGTVVNGWVNGNGGGISVTGSGLIPSGGLTINNSTVTTSAAGQIDASNAVTLGASSTLTLVGNNTLASLSFDNYGGVGNATVATGGVLSLTGSISATSNSVSTLPVINGTLDFAGGARTFDIQPIAYNGATLSTLQPTMNIAAVIQNAGKITINGGGNLQLSGASTFAGGVDLTEGGLVLGASSTPTGGGVVSGPLGIGTLTMSSGTTLLSTTGVTISNGLTFLGNANFDGVNNLTFTGNTTLPLSPVAINVAAPQQAVALIGNLVNPATNITKTGYGALNLTTDYTGTVTLTSGGALGFLTDGNGTGTPETITSGSVTSNGGTVITVGRAGFDFAPYFTQAQNKTIELSSLTTNGGSLSVTNNNSYGLKVSNGQVFTNDQVYSVATATNSNVVQGLTMSGVLSGGFGIVKQGAGALVLGNTGNTFGGLGKSIDIQGGIVAAGSDGALGNSENTVRLNVAGTAGVGFRATNTFGTARTFTFSQTTNAIEVVDGATLTVAAPFGGLSATTTLVKNDNGMLTLAAPNSASWSGSYTLGGALTGGVMVNAGTLRITDSAALGAATNPIVVFNTTNAAVQVAGGVTVPNPLTLNHLGSNTYAGGLNWTGMLRSVSGSNTWSGLIQQNQDGGISADAGSTLNITGGISFKQHIVIFGGAGNVNVSGGALTEIHSLDKIGSGKTAIQAAGTMHTTGNGIRVFGGTLEFSGASGAVSGTTTLPAIINPGGTLVLDSSGSVLSNRLGGRVMTLAGGNLNLIGGVSVTNEAIGAPTFARGQSTVTVTAGTGGANLTFTTASNNVAPAQNAGTAPSGATVLFRGTSLGTAAGGGIATIQSTGGGLLFNGQTGATGTTNKAILPWAIIDTTANGLGISFATGDAAAAATNTTAILRPLTAGEYGTGNLAANLNMLVSTGLTGQNTVSVNSLTFDPGGSIAMNAGQTLTNQSGGILVRNGVTTSISGGVMTAPAGNSPWSIHTPGTASLAISSILNGGNGNAVGLVKAGDGLVVLTTPLSTMPGFTAMSANTLNMQTVVNQGTLRLAGGTNTLGANNFLHVSPGGTLDLNGTSQYVQGLFTDGTYNGIPDTVTAGGTVTSATPSTLVVNSDARNWAGTITGNIFFNRTGTATATTVYAPQTYTGATLINGGTVSLRDYAKLANTSAIDVTYAFLTLDNTQAASISGRLGSAPLTLRGSTLTFNGRAQTASSDSIGSVSIAEGWNNISVTNAGTGVNSSDLTLASLLHPVGSAGVVNLANPSGAAQQTGQLGSVSRLLISSAPTLSNNLIGPWAIASREWASYIPGLGTGKLNDPGFAGYAATNLATGTATDNIRITATPAALIANSTVNTLNVNFAANTLVDLGGNTLTLSSGGLMFATGTDNTTATLGNGNLTSGAASGDLYVYHLPYAGTGRQAVISANVVNNGPNPVRLIVSQSEQSGNAKSVTISGVNTNTGGFVANLGTTVIGATGVLPAGGITLNSATLNQTGAGQASVGTINSANVVTLNGPSTLGFVGTNTIAGIVFNNTGATSAGAAATSASVNPTVSSFIAGFGNNGTGTLTVGAGGIVANSSNVATTAIVAGRLDSGSGLTITTNPITVNGVSVAPLQASLAIQGWVGSGAITKTGNGVLQLNSQEVATGALNVTAGGVAFGPLGNTGLAGNNSAGSRYSALNLSANTFLNLSNTDGTIGSLSGSGNVFNAASNNGVATGRTLNLGFDNSSTTFSGAFSRWTDAFPASFQVNKIGLGTLTLTGASTTTNNLQVSQGGVTFSGAGTGMFGTNLVLPTGTLTLDNSGANVANRMGGATNIGTLTVGGGNFRIIGNAAAATTETIGTVNLGTSTNNIYGTPVVTLEANAAQSLTFAVGTTWGGIPVGSSSLIRGISGTAGVGLANFSLGAIAIGSATGSGTGANGTTTMAIRPDILGDASINGLGTGFIVKDSVTNFLRPIAVSELAGNLLTGLSTATVNYALNSSFAGSGRTIAGSLTLNAGGGVAQFSGLSSGTPAGLPVSTVVNTGGILAFDGNGGIASSRLETQNNTAFHFHTHGDLSVNSVLFGTSGGLNKGEAGTLILGARNLYTGQTQINAGTLILAGGDNTLPLLITGGAPTTTQLGVNSPTAVVNFNGTNQITGTIGNNQSARYVGSGGTYTNTSATPSSFTSISGSAQAFGGSLTGNLSFSKTGNNALTFTNNSTYTGATNIRANTLTLIDGGALSGTSVVNLMFATLALDQGGLNPIGNLNPVRVPASVPVNLMGGTVSLTGGGSVDSSATFNTVNLVQSHNTISVPQAPTGGTAAINIGNLVRAANPDATVNFTGGTGGFFSNNPGLNQSNVFINSIDGVAIPATITGKILGGWALANNGEFVTYVSPGTTGSNGQNYGIVTMNGTTGVLGAITQTLYDATTIAAGSNPTVNVRINGTGTQTIGAGGATINALAVRAALTNLNFTGATDALNLASGGLALTNGGTTVGVLGTGRLTAGGTQSSGNAPLYVYSAGATNTINAAIVDNGAGAKTRLVVTPIANQLNLAAANTYTGGTVINAGGGGVTLTGAASTVVIPAGGVTINNATLTMATNAGQIESSNSVTLNGGATLTLVGTNTLSNLMFNNIGGTANPSVAVGSELILSSANPITVVNDNAATVPTISGTLLTLQPGANINTSTTAGVPTNLVISAPIASTGVINKTNSGSLVLSSGASTFAGGISVNGGTLILGANSTLTSGVLTNGPLGIGTLTLGNGTALISDSAVRNVANAVEITGNVTFGSISGSNGSAVATNGVTLSGNVNLGSGVNRTINVNSHLNVSTISGIMSGIGTALMKTGPGTLALTGINTFDGGVEINGGVLQAGAQGLGATGTVTFSGGILQHAPATPTDFSSRFSTANNQPIYVDTNNQTVTYASPIVSAIGGSLGKFGAGTLILTEAANYNGPTIISAGVLQVGAGSSIGSIPSTSPIINSGTFQVNRAEIDVVNIASITGGGGITIDQGTLAPLGVVNLGGALTFGSVNGTTTFGALDLSAVNANFGSALVRTNSFLPASVNLPTGRTLAINGNLTLGYDAGTGTGATNSRLTVSGGGSMSVTGTTISISVNQAVINAGYFSAGILDVTSLSSFATNVTTFNVGVGTTTTGTGAVNFSDTANVVLATTMTVGDSGANNGNGTSTVTLGAGTNLFQLDTLNVGRGKGSSPGVFKFASQTGGSPGAFILTNRAGTGGAAINIADNNGTATAGAATGTLDLRGHVSIVTATALTIGRLNMASNTGSTTGTLNFDAGTFSVDTINMAPKTGAGTGTANATMNIGGGTFTVNTGGSFTLGSQTGSGAATAVFNLTGGTFTSNANIVEGGGTTTSTLTVDGGTLDMTGKNIGGAIPIDNLNLRSGVLANVGEINNGGPVVKTTAGTLFLPTSNAYSGSTTIAGGVLSVGSLADGGLNSSIGKSSSSAANLVIDGATLQYTGPATSTNRQFTIGSNNATLDASGSGTVTFSNSAPVTFSAANNAQLVTFDGTGSGVLAASISNNGTGQTSLEKNGSGSWTLSGANTYSGPTTINSGRLLVGDGVSGSLSGTTVFVNNGGGLGGRGTVGTVIVDAGGSVNPGMEGTGTGRLTTGDIDFAIGSTLELHFGGTNAGAAVAGYDQLNVTGTLTISGSLTGSLVNGFSPSYGTLFTIALNDGNDIVIGEFDNAAFNSAFSTTYKTVVLNGQSFLISYFAEGGVFDAGGAGNDIALMAVPEPGTAALLLGGIAMLARRRRRSA